MGRVMLRRVATTLPGLALAIAGAAPLFPASAVVIGYTMTVLPLTATAEQVTDFSVTVLNVAGPDELGCVEVDLPATYEIHAVSDPVQSAGRDWTATWDDDTVIAWSESGGGRLRLLQSVTFVVTARPTKAEVADWSHHAHRREDCNDGEQAGLPVPVTVVPPILPTPTPAPTASPTVEPTPTVKPTSRPTAVPTPAPTLSPRPTASAAEPPQPTNSPDAAPRPSSSTVPASTRPTPAVPPDGVSDAGGPGAPGGPAADAPGVRVVPLDAMRVAHAWADGAGDGGPMGVGTLAAMPGSAMFAVPVAVLGGPGLLIIAWVALQALGVATWIPAVRRLRGRDADSG